MAVGLISSIPDKRVPSPSGKRSRFHESERRGEQGGDDLAIAVPDRTGGEPHQGPKPDAPLTRLRRAAIGGVHLVVIAAIVGLFVWCAVKAVGALPGSEKAEAIVTLVASSLVELHSPADGVFEAAQPLLVGSHVERGQLLGTVRPRQLQESLDEARGRLEALQRQKLLLDPQGMEFEDPASGLDQRREFRQVALQLIATENELSRLRQIEQDSQIRSPVNGQIHYGLSGSRAVKATDTVAHIWPDSGDLLVEVKAPLKVIHRLIQSNRVEAVFPTAGGKVEVTARPVPGSLRTVVEQWGPQKATELWGVLQCTAVSIPGSVRTPGLIGRLR
jgi:hypothetical protein